MSLFFSRKKKDISKEIVDRNQALIISVSNLSLNDTSDGVVELLTTLPKKSRKLIIEMPCLGVPRLASVLLDSKTLKELTKETTMDQLLLDLDRGQLNDLKSYMHQSQQMDLLLLNPRTQPDTPIIRSVTLNETLIRLPLLIRQKLQDQYDFIIMVTQGQLVNPTTYFTIRSADAIVLFNQRATDVTQNLKNYKRLQETFHISEERLFLFSTDRNMKLNGKFNFYTRSKLLFKMIQQTPFLPADTNENEGPKLLENEQQLGFINPIDYLKHTPQFDKEEQRFTSNEATSLDKIAKITRKVLQADHLDDFVASLMNPDARVKVRHYIADIIRGITDMPMPGGIDHVIEWVQKEITEMSVLQELLDDPEISNIDINGIDKVMIEKNGVMMHAEHIRFENIHHLYRVINRMLSPMGKRLSGTTPTVDTVYYGVRICAVADTQELSGLSGDSPLLSIRKFPPNVFSDEQCIANGNSSQALIDFLRFIIPNHVNVVVAGGTNSGKTSTLIRFPLFVDRLTRIIQVEDMFEMLLQNKPEYKNYPNIVSMKTKELEDVTKSYNMGRLIRTTMRMSPFVIAIGEIRDETGALEALRAGNTGHSVWATTHSNSCESAATRILQLNGNTAAAAAQISETFDLFIFQKRMKDGRRVITKVAELIGYKGVEHAVLNTIFYYDERRKKHYQVGRLKSDRTRDRISNDWPEEVINRWCDFSDPMEEYKIIEEAEIHATA